MTCQQVGPKLEVEHISVRHHLRSMAQTFVEHGQ